MPINLGELVLDGSQAKEALQQLDGLLKLSGTDVQNLNKMFLESSSAAQNYKNLNAQLAQARAELKAATIGTQEFTAAAEKIAAVTQQINPVRASLQGLNAETGAMGRSFLTGHRFMTSFSTSLGMMPIALSGTNNAMGMLLERLSMGSMYFDMLTARAEASGVALGPALVEQLTGPGGILIVLAGLAMAYEAVTRMMGKSEEQSGKNAEAVEKEAQEYEKLRQKVLAYSASMEEAQKYDKEAQKTTAERLAQLINARQVLQAQLDAVNTPEGRRSFVVLGGADQIDKLKADIGEMDKQITQLQDQLAGKGGAVEDIQTRINAVMAKGIAGLSPQQRTVDALDVLKQELEKQAKAAVEGTKAFDDYTRALGAVSAEEDRLNQKIEGKKEKPEKEPEVDKSLLSERLKKGVDAQSKELERMAAEQTKAYNEGLVEASVAAENIKNFMAQAADPEQVKKLQGAYDSLWDNEAKIADERRAKRAQETEQYLKGLQKGGVQEQRDTEQMIMASQRLGDALVGAFARGDKGAQEVLKILNEMAAVAMLIYTITSAANPASIIGGIAGVISGAAHLFGGGGYTGTGNASQPAGIVHRGEVVFEKPLVDKYGSQIMSIRRMMQQPTGYDEMLQTNRILATAHRIVSSAPSGGGASDARIVGAIGSLHARLAGLEGSINKIADAIANMPAPVAQINNPVLLSDELEKEWPKQTAKYNNKFGNS